MGYPADSSIDITLCKESNRFFESKDPFEEWQAQAVFHQIWSALQMIIVWPN
jgi:hypothetical protein